MYNIQCNVRLTISFSSLDNKSIRSIKIILYKLIIFELYKKRAKSTGNSLCVCAVSYTHLDVYKRQVLHSNHDPTASIPQIVSCVCSKACLNLFSFGLLKALKFLTVVALVLKNEGLSM